MIRVAKTLAIVAALVFAACGGSDAGAVDRVEPAESSQASSAPTTVETTQVNKTEADEPAATESAREEPTATLAEGTGIAVVGDRTWEFALSGDAREMCSPNLSGLFLVSLFGQDDDGGEVVLAIQAAATGGVAVVQAGRTDISDELWIADANVYADYGDIALPDGIGASAEVNGNTVSGTGAFYEDRALSATRTGGSSYDTGVLEGTFTVTCPGTGS